MARICNIKHTRTQHTNRGIVLSLSNIYIKKEKNKLFMVYGIILTFVPPS